MSDLEFVHIRSTSRRIAQAVARLARPHAVVDLRLQCKYETLV